MQVLFQALGIYIIGKKTVNNPCPHGSDILLEGRQAVNKKTGKINKIITAFDMCYDRNR